MLTPELTPDLIHLFKWTTVLVILQADICQLLCPPFIKCLFTRNVPDIWFRLAEYPAALTSGSGWWTGQNVERERICYIWFRGRGFESCLGAIVQWPWASYLHLCASVTKQYNLVPVKGRWRSEAGRWPYVWRRTGHVSQTLWFIHLQAQDPCKGDEHSA